MVCDGKQRCDGEGDTRDAAVAAGVLQGDDEAARVKQLLLDAPAGHTFRWGDNQQQVRDDVLAYWVDVVIPELCDQLGWNWVWTVSDPVADAAEGIDSAFELGISVPYDVTLHSLVSGVRTLPDAAVAVPVGTDLAASQEAVLDSVALALGATRHQQGAWSVATLNAALATHAQTCSGRTDLQFEFDPNIVG